MRKLLTDTLDRFKLWVSHLLSHFIKPKFRKVLTFVLDETARGWILETTCQHLSENIKKITTDFHYDLKNLPKSEYYFFPHYFYYKKALIHNPFLWHAKSIIYFTHPREDLGVSINELQTLLNRAHGVAVLNTNYKDLLVSWGIAADKIQVIHFGVSLESFIPHTRNTKSVGFSMALYERKNPKLVVNIVKKMPDVKFQLFGKGWEGSSYYKELSSCGNFSYSEPSYPELPKCYQNIDVLVSTSLLEGGPTPILEALASNVVPVCTTVGFAPDLISNGQNGFLFSPNDSIEHIEKLIRNALELKTDVTGAAKVGSWENCSLKFENFLK